MKRRKLERAYRYVPESQRSLWNKLRASREYFRQELERLNQGGKPWVPSLDQSVCRGAILRANVMIAECLSDGERDKGTR